MGHVRIGRLPKRWGWEDVIAALSSQGESDKTLIAATARAASRTLLAAQHQESIALAYWTFVDLAAASRTATFLERVPQTREHLTGLSLIKLISGRLEQEIRSRAGCTALDEIALETFNTVILGTVRDASQTLFGCTVETVQSSLRELSTKSGVAWVGRRFFSEYAYRALRFALEKELARSLRQGRFRTSGDLSRFDERLKTYCSDVSRIVEDYSGGWYSKAVWEKRLTLEEARHFTGYAIEKLLSELSTERSSA